MPSKPNYIRNVNKPWSAPQTKTLANLAAKNTPTRVIGFKLGRTVSGIEAQAQKSGISLKPTNQAPYSRQAKKN